MRTTDQRATEHRRIDTDALASAWTAAIDVLEGETQERAPLALWFTLRELEWEAQSAAVLALTARSRAEPQEECERLALAEYRAALAHSVVSLVALALAARRQSGKALALAVD